MTIVITHSPAKSYACIQIPGLHLVPGHPSVITFGTSTLYPLPQLVQITRAALQQLAADRGHSVGELSVRPSNLEDVFLMLTGRSLS